MTKGQLIANLQRSSRDLTKTQVTTLVDNFILEVSKAIRKENRFSMPGFGTFTVKRRAARKGRNPQTGVEIRIKASRTVGFKPAPTLKKAL